jgi:hypothetical protein
MILSGGFEALFGLSALVATAALVGGSKRPIRLLSFSHACLAPRRSVLEWRRSWRGTSLNIQVGSPRPTGLALSNVLAACVIPGTAASTALGGAALWGAGLVHAVFSVQFVYALVAGRQN